MRESFKEYMKRYANIDHRFGDLACEIVYDDNYPNSDDLRENLNYLISRDAGTACFDTFCDAWVLYRTHPHDQTALYIAMLLEKFDMLNANTGTIAEALKILCDVQDLANPLVSISDEIEETANVMRDRIESSLCQMAESARHMETMTENTVSSFLPVRYN